VSKAAEPGPFFGWRPGGDGTHRVFFLDRNGAELSRMIDSEGVRVHNFDDYHRYSIVNVVG
jgi:hypothetical protein